MDAGFRYPWATSARGVHVHGSWHHVDEVRAPGDWNAAPCVADLALVLEVLEVDVDAVLACAGRNSVLSVPSIFTYI